MRSPISRPCRTLQTAGALALVLAVVACTADSPVTSPSAPVVPPGTTPSTPAPAAASAIRLSREDVVFNRPPAVAVQDSFIIDVTGDAGRAVTGLATTIGYAAGQPHGWLAATLDRSTVPARLALRAATTPLAEGSYGATVTVAATGAPPVTIDVTARVVSGLAIGLSAAKICFTPTFGGPDASPDDVRITSVDGAPVDGVAASVTYAPGQPQGWLGTSLGGTTAPARLWLRSTMGSLAPGSYTATVAVTSSSAGNSPQSVQVTLEVRPRNAPPTATLNVTIRPFLNPPVATSGASRGPANGRVTAPGIDCTLVDDVQEGDCSEAYPVGTVVTLIPAAAPRSYFGDWMGTCAGGTSTGCEVSMSQDRAVVAQFDPLPSFLELTLLGANGMVFGNEVSGCQIRDGVQSGYCSPRYWGGVIAFTLTGFPQIEGGVGRLGWSGDCASISGNQCRLSSLPGDTLRVTATFTSE